VLRDAEEIRQALASAGWTVSGLREGTLRDTERVYDVTNVQARRGGLRASVVVLRDCKEGGFVDRFGALSSSPTLAVRRTGDTKVVVDVQDYERACSEAEGLLPVMRQEGIFQSWRNAVAARGWRVVDESSESSFFWDQSWQLRAERPGESLDIGVVLGTLETEETITESTSASGAAVSRVGEFTAYVTATSARAASELADALVGRWASPAGR
jgi:hypothetical protein